MRKKLLFLLAMSLLWSVPFADDITDGSGVPGEYLLEMAGDAREFGRGGGSVALIDNTAAIYHNPAGLGSIEYMEAMIDYSRFFNDFNYYHGAFAYPFGKYGTLGIGLTGMVSPEGIKYDDFGIPLNETFTSSKNTVFISYGKLFLERFGVGANVKIASHSMDDFFGMGVGFDIGLTAKAFDWLVFGLTLMHIGGPRITLDSDPDRFSSALKFGIGSQLLEKSLSLNADVHVLELFPDENAYNKDNIRKPIKWGVGAEYWFIPYLSLRAGVNGSITYGDGTSAHVRMVTVGPGFKVKQFSADYSFLIHTEEKEFRSAPAHSVSIRYCFGKPIPKMEEELDNKLEDMQKIEKMHFIEQLYIQGYYQKAYSEIKLLEQKHPKDPEVKKLLEQVRAKVAAVQSTDLMAQVKEEFDKKNYTEAEKMLKEIIELDPDNQEADSLRQKILAYREISTKMAAVEKYYAQEDFESMAMELDVVLTMDSTNEEALEYKDKIKDYLTKRDADKGYNLAYKYYHDNNDVESANSELQKVLTIMPDHEDANKLYQTISKEVKNMYLQKVGQMVNQDKLDVDNDALKNLIKIDAQDQIVQARKMLGNKQLTQALAAVEAVLQNDPSNSQALQLKEEIAEAQGVEKSEMLYNEALKLFNDNKLEEAETKVTEALALQASYQKALDLQKEIQTNIRKKNLTLVKDKMSSGDQKDLEEAESMVKEYLAVDSENEEAKKMLVDIQTELLIIKANNHIDNDEYEKAEQTIRKALALNPDSEKVQQAFKNIKEVIDLFSGQD